MTPQEDPPSARVEFGTDGLRGRAGEPPLDARTLRHVGAALGLWLQHSGPETKRVLFGNDGRESATWILDAIAQGLASTDCASVDVGLTTTPALAFLTRTERFVAGVMISASHNPADDNGIKIFQQDGRKLPDEAEREIEELTGSVDFDETRPASTRENARLLDRYLEHLGNEFSGLDLGGATIVVDAANGGASYVAPQLLRMLGADVVEVACEPDGANINAGCGAMHPENIVDVVRRSAAVLGISLDGDGDRCILVDDTGRIHDGDGVLATLGPHLKELGQLADDCVVATVMSNLGLRNSLAAHGIRVETTPVGDRHVSSRMQAGKFSLGGEQSGHVLFDRGGYLVGDGLYTALKILSLPGLVRGGASRCLVDFRRFPQKLVNVEVARKPDLDSVPSIRDAKRGIERELGDDGRVVLRYSGTERVCRVMIEGPDETIVDSCMDRLTTVVKDELS